jgi:predicted nucleic acid-binding protein
VVYLDTNILVYLLEQHGALSTRVADILDTLRAENNSFVTSTMTITEFLAGTKSSSLATLLSIPQLDIHPLSEETAARAGDLQRKNGLQIGDAIHLAAALQANADLLLTNDRKLAKIAKKHLPVQTLE